MKISAIIECYNTNSSLADTNLDTVRFYQMLVKCYLASYLVVQGSFKRNREGKYLVAVEKMRKGKKTSEEKRRDVTYAERRWKLQKS